MSYAYGYMYDRINITKNTNMHKYIEKCKGFYLGQILYNRFNRVNIPPHGRQANHETCLRKGSILLSH